MKLNTAAFTIATLVAVLGVHTAAAQDQRIGIVALYDNVFWVDVRRGVAEVLADVGTINLNSGGDAATQATNVTNLTSAAVDGVLIGPVSSDGAVADLNRFKRENIPVICVDSCADSSVAPDFAVGWASTDGADLGHAVGRAAVDYIESAMGGSATIGMIVCDSLGPVCSLRHDAIDVELKAVPEAKVVAIQDAFQPEKTVPKVVDMLTANPEITLIIVNNGGAAEGAVAAIKQLGMRDSVKVFGIDMSNVTGRDLLEDDPIILYTVAQDSYNMGRVGAQMLLDHWNGKAIDEFRVNVPVQEFPVSDPAAIQQWIDERS